MRAKSLCLAAVAALLTLGPAWPVAAAANLQITEFMAKNTFTLADKTGQYPDWIEIHNAGTNTADLTGWFLSNKPGSLTQWSFPATNLAANGYMVVFASGTSQRIPGLPLHTNFKLGATGEYLALVQPDGVTVAFAYSPTFPIQVANSWLYGFWDKTTDNDGIYADSEFVAFAPSVWRSATIGWVVATSGAPWTRLTKTGGRPNGANSGDVQWAIRRYVSETNGAIRLTGTLAHSVTNCGDGFIARIFLDGAQIYQQTIFSNSISYSLMASVNLGSHVDFVIEPGAADDDNCDLATFSATIRTADPLVAPVADSIADWSYSGTQGEKNWFYGYYNVTEDTFPGYQTTNFTAFPSDNGPPSAFNFC